MQKDYYLQTKYLNLLSGSLKKFKKKNNDLWNCRCPFCGDSKKNESKARGYFFKADNALVFKCHNCGTVYSFDKFLKLLDQNTYDQYKAEEFTNKQIIRKIISTKTEEKPAITKKDIGLQSVQSLSANHIARRYVVQRKIPEKYYSEMYYAESYSDWIKSYDILGKYSKLKSDQRLVLPVFNRNNDLVGAQGRSLENSEIRYITCKWTENTDFVYGTERWNRQQKTFVVEGPIDSLFLPNCIACMGSDFCGCIDKLSQYVNVEKQNLVLVFDNEKRNVETVKKLSTAVTQGYSVFIWPNNINQKDINDLILAGMSEKEILSLINKRTFKDLAATLELAMWKL